MNTTQLQSPPEAHYTVYKLTDPQGKIYIGCTGKSVEERWRKGNHYSKGSPIRIAIDTFGWEAFDKQILCEKLTREGAEKLEKWFIAHYDSSDPEKGYNRFLGGLGKGSHMSEITKKISSESKYRLYEEHPELKERIRKSVHLLFENDPDYRKRVSRGVLAAHERDPSIKTRLSEISKQLWQDEDFRARATEGRAAVNVGNTELSAKMQQSSRLYFLKHPERRAEISAQMSKYLQTPEGRKFVESSSKPKPVRCVETGEVFPSQLAAEKATGLCSIHRACTGQYRTSGGYHWEYIKQPSGGPEG